MLEVVNKVRSRILWVEQYSIQAINQLNTSVSSELIICIDVISIISVLVSSVLES